MDPGFVLNELLWYTIPTPFPDRLVGSNADVEHENVGANAVTVYEQFVPHMDIGATGWPFRSVAPTIH
jgi:hypothetical protein